LSNANVVGCDHVALHVGILDVAGVHEIDFIRAIMAGDVRSVRALAAPQIDPRYDCSGNIHVLLKFCSGAVGSMDASFPTDS
jgi:hypothetical protein